MENVGLKFQQLTDAHSRAEIPAVIENPYNTSQIISIGHDCFIRSWNKENLTGVKTTRIISPYLTSIVAFDGKFLLGIGNGNLVVLNSELEIEKEIPLHEDCLTSISILPQYIVTTSFDGKVFFLNKETLEVEKNLFFDIEIYQCLYHQEYLYLAGNPSYKIDIKTFEITEIGTYNQFIIHQDNIFGNSEENGITCLNDNISILFSCHYMLSVGNSILLSTDQGIGMLIYDHEEEGNWQISLISEFKGGCATLSAIYDGKNVFIVGESGELYKFKMIENEKKEGISKKISTEEYKNMVMA